MAHCTNIILSLNLSKFLFNELTIYLGFIFRMRSAINELAPCNGIVIKESRDGSGRGAAMVAAVACRLAAQQ